MTSPTVGRGVATSSGCDDLPRLGVVVLNWNSAWFTRRCLTAVADSDYPSDRLRVILVDNGSVDGSLEVLVNWLTGPDTPKVEVLANDQNLGFAEGCNRAMRVLVSSGEDRVDHVVLLNNDAWPEPGWLREMAAVMTRRDGCAAVSARLVLEPSFFQVRVPESQRAVEVRSVELQGPAGIMDVTTVVRTHGFSDEGALLWPARRLWRLGAGDAGTIWVPADPCCDRVTVVIVDDRGATNELTTVLDGAPVRLLNGIGTGLNESGEGFDIGYGEPDDGSRDTPREVSGFCGGAVMLRSDALRAVGLFDPGFFAYYEDTDLAWRMRNAGWKVYTAPAAVVHHAFGASGGGGSQLHVFLDRRNWLLTSLRNGTGGEIRSALGWLRRAVWRLFRVNVFGRVRRRQPVQREPLRTWLVAVAAALGGWGAGWIRRVLAPSRKVGEDSTDRVRSRLQPPGGLPEPSVRPGGPLLVYVDVGETLKAGYRAGIQRVLCALTTALGESDEPLEIVAVRWCPRNQRFRRITSEEYASLLRAGHAPEPIGESAAVHGIKALLRAALDRAGLLAAVRTRRERIFGRRGREVEDSLVLGHFARGSVFLELDAVWNEVKVDRAALLVGLRSDGVHTAAFIHDLLPLQRPEWFSEQLREIFTPVVLAQLRNSELLLCASEATRRAIAEVCAAEGIVQPPVTVAALGTDDLLTTGREGRDHLPSSLPQSVGKGRYLLMVGTMEPRKNHALALSVFDELSSEFHDLHLVMVGRQGWGVDDLLRSIDSHPLRGDRLHWLDDVYDEDLDSLYRRAFLVLVPSLGEGFGLPVAEALARSAPVIASAGGSLPEVGGSSAVYLDPYEVPAWAAEVRRRLSGESGETPGSETNIRATPTGTAYEPRSWRAAASDMAGALLHRFRAHPRPS